MIILNPQNRQDNHFPLVEKRTASFHENHYAWASTTGDAIERHTNKKKERKVPKERKKILLYIILIINNHQQ